MQPPIEDGFDEPAEFEETEAHPRPGRAESVLGGAQDQFILEWGRMSSSWGINRTMAQIHALLFVTGIPLEVNEIMDRLQISRGNASMNLRELMDWGVVRRFRQPGDRKDTYITETDPYQMIIRIVKERKRREIDPTAEAIEEILSRLPEGDPDEATQSLRKRLTALLEIFGLADVVYKQLFINELTFDELRDAVKTSRLPGDTGP
ncbi:COG1510 Predicted transcriptional regulators [Fimbriimonadaceae bacterium]